MRKNIYMHPQGKKKIRRPEQTVQVGVFSHLRPLMELQRYEKFLCFHCPNGGGRSAVEAGILRGMGTMSGVADIIVLIAEQKAVAGHWGYEPPKTVFIELKLKSMKTMKGGKDKGKIVARATPQSDDQILFQGRVTAMGFPYYLVESLDVSDALNQILAIIKTEGGFEW